MIIKGKKIADLAVILSGLISLPVSGAEFKLNPVTDGVLLGTGSAIYGTQLVLSKGLKLNQNLYQGEICNLENVNGFDAKLAHPYNHTVDKISDGLLISSFALPLTLAGADNSEWLKCFTMYAETMLLAQGIKESIKLAVYRPRPYMYFEGWPEKDVLEEHDWANSFVSGHSTMSFAAATFTSYVFWNYFPDSPWRFAVAAGSYGLCCTVAGMRIAAGCHFPTDVLCGAVLGTSMGFLVPWLHTLDFGKDEKAPKLAVVPNGVMVTMKF